MRWWLAAALVTTLGIADETSAQDKGASRDDVTLVACVAREADFPRATVEGAIDRSQVVLTAVDSTTPTHALTGLRERELAGHAGRRVEVSGTIERPRSTPVLTTAEGARTGSVTTGAAGATGVTPDGAAAHEPADALGATVKAGPVPPAVTNADDPAYRAATVPRLNVTSFRVVAGTCLNPAAAASTTSRPSPVAVVPPVQAPAAPAPREVIARGCLMRLTPGGTASTPQRGSEDPLVLTQASLNDDRTPTTSAAVPGAGPTDRGSGTVPSPAPTRGSVTTDAAKLTFALSIGREGLSKVTPLIGDRVEVVGVLEDQSTSPPDRAHTSAPIGRIAVSELRPMGGACR
jgi:hypothetical protein